MNKLTNCKVSEMIENILKITVELSDTSQMNANFEIASNGSINFHREDACVQNVTEETHRWKYNSYPNMIEKALIGELFNDNLKKMSVMKMAIYLSTWRREVCGCKFTFMPRSKCSIDRSLQLQ
jgi:hypothetical protein